MFFCLFSLCACLGKRAPAPADGAPQSAADQDTTMATGAKRADPGYIQHLERLSMLGAQTEFARVVSGSHIAWLRPADQPFPEPLLALADTWIAVNPLSMLSENKQSVFASFASPRYWRLLGRARINGAYFSPVNGAGALWAYNRKASPRGEDAIQYAFSEAAGSDNDYFKLLSAANANRKLIGLELTPATTGLGPDFFLAARQHRQFSGAYCMVELPHKTWNSLPKVPDQWRGEPLADAHVAALAAQNLLPPAMAQDFFPTGKKGGWAVTGEIHGVDGLPRRWAYRYYGSPDRPVLNWEDPSAAARKILSGSVIRSVGMLGGALVGMRLEGLYGLEAAAHKGVSPAYSPADRAAVDVSREVRRYGGWSYLQDETPFALIDALMAHGPDFFQDHVFSPGVEHAILTGSTTLLETMTDEALAMGLDMRRFVHSTITGSGVSYELAHLASVAAGASPALSISPKAAGKMRANVLAEAQNALYASTLTAKRGDDVPPLQGRRLFTTSAGLAAMALGAGNAESATKDMEPLIRDGHLLQVFFRAMLPGLFMISGQDLAGTLPLSWYETSHSSGDWDVGMTSRGAYALTQSADASPVTAQGVAKAKSVYPTADVQLDMEDSFMGKLADILAVRTSLNIPGGRLHGRFETYAPSCFALAVVLPSLGPNMAAANETGEDAFLPDAETALAAVDEAAKEAVAAGPAPLDARAEGGRLRDADAAGRKASLGQRRARRREEDERARAGLERRIITAPSQERREREEDAAVVAVFNFSRNPIRETLNLYNDPALRRIREKGTPLLLTHDRSFKGGETDIFMSYGPKTITLALPPWTGAAVLIGKKPQ